MDPLEPARRRTHAITVPGPVRDALLALPAPRCAYVYDTATLRSVAASLRDALRRALPGQTELLYAVKANSHPGVVGALVGIVDGFEVASAGELALVPAGGAAGRVAFSGPAKTDAQLRAAVAAGVTVHVESLLELRRLGAAARAAATPVTAALRVNRAVPTLPGTHQMTGVPTPFGMPETDLAQAAAIAHDLPFVRLVGFHLHAVSNNLDAAAHATFVVEAVRWSVAAAARLDLPLGYVNVGGGFGVDYTGEDRFDVRLFAGGLREGLPRAGLPGGARLVFEPGRFVAATAGWYAAEVVDLKRTHGRWFAVLRGGTHHFRLPAAWRYSHPCVLLPVEEWPHPFARPQVRGEAVDVVGELCTPRDVLARDQDLGGVRVGDLIVLPHTGAYGWDISHHGFLRHDPPQFLVI